MKITAKTFPWEEQKLYDAGNWALERGDIVVVNTEYGAENMTVQNINVKSEEDAPKIIRKANSIDIETIDRNKEKAKEAVKICRKLAKEKELSMKIVDSHFSFDGGKVVFSFIAEKRVDFRDLVKALSKKFQRSIRLQQIGSRDEARKKGGFGMCGRELCCIKFSGSLKSVTTEDARIQQMGQRGSERLSGLCGRLKCCLGFESEQYRKILEKMPKPGEIVRVRKEKAVVVDRDIVSEKITVEFEKSGKKENISLNDLK